MLPNPYYGTLMTAKLRWYREEILYVGSLNMMSISMAVVFPPSYWRHGSNVMTYSGLGVQFARQLANKVDYWNRYRHPDEENWARWNNSRGISVLTSPKKRKAMVDSLAVEVALATMKRVMTVDSSQLQLQHLEKFTPIQTFYLSYCSHFISAVSTAPVKCVTWPSTHLDFATPSNVRIPNVQVPAILFDDPIQVMSH